MTSLLVEMRRPIDPPADDGFEVSYVSGDGAEHRVPLAQAWAELAGSPAGTGSAR
jgi:hypothetical protein